MPVPAYSVVLWEVDTGGGGGGVIPGPGPDPGFVWVVRSVTAWNYGVPAGAGVTQLQFLCNSFISWATPPKRTRSHVLYELLDGRLVLQEGEIMGVETIAGAWQVRVCGYQLTA